MSLRRVLRINKNNFPLSKRHMVSLPDLDRFTKSNLNPKATIDERPISLRFRVSSLIELCQLQEAEGISRLAVTEKYRGLDSDSEKKTMRNEIIAAMCAAKRHDDAIALYYCFLREPSLGSSAIKLCSPFLFNRHCVNADTIRLLTKVLVDAGRIDDAHIFVKGRRELSDSVAYSYLIRGFLDLGNKDKAYELVDEMNRTSDDGPGRRRAVVDATFMDYWFKQGEDEKAMEIYRSREGEEVVCAATGNTLLEMLLDNGKQAEAWKLFHSMITNSNTFDRETFVTMVNACFKLGLFKEALETFKRPELTRSSRCYANIIANFCDRGMMSQAQDLFAEMCSAHCVCPPDVPTFRSMINGYAKVGRVDDAIEMLKKMVDATLLKFAVQEAR
ncbi:unnamed protein product [Microthlaspi erraticum]|uniref:Pentacotripeptide-repeat region of PRORP domain-containing protein n=1 Tax=Microthlaspi erraticum TaxID=1685480 RepID=A0A6D2KM38_9BRAS|nr:unnamed protein product [Microthlaspi erraticum]